MRLVPFALLALAACANRAPGSERYSQMSQSLLGESATGSVPSGLPARFMLGLSEGPGESWMSSSAVPWDLRYQYLTKDWVTNWGYGARDGSFALSYFYDCYDADTIPVVEYYQIVGEPGGGEQEILAKLGSAGTMNSYFTDFEILMQRVKDYGAPVVVLVEADGFGFVQTKSADDPAQYAAIADSGLSELAGLPNTLAGWGLAYLALKKAVGADNALLALHVSSWATNYDVMQNNDSDIATEVDVAYWYLSQLGLADNQTGITYDLIVTDPSDRDADYYKQVQGQDRWWDASDSAATTARSLNRYAEWLRQWNVKSGKRWLLWQIPLGNSNHLNTYNNGGAREGYKDNRPEYFIGNGTAHLQKFADSGVIGLLFGPGTGGMSMYVNDYYTDGQLFMKSRAKAIYDSGGLDVAPGLDWTASDAGPRPRPEGGVDAAPPLSGGVDDGFDAQYEFETAMLDGWASSGDDIGSVATSSANHFRGKQALALPFGGAGGTSRVFVQNPAIPAGVPYVAFHVFVPAGHTISAIQPYVQQGAWGGYAWTGNWQSADRFETNAWNLVPVMIPSDAQAPFLEIGIEIFGDAGFTGTLYVDSVGWPDGSASAGGSVDGSVAADGAASGGGSVGGSSASGGSSSNGPAGAPNTTTERLGTGCSCRLVTARSRTTLAEWSSLLLIFTLPLLRRARCSRNRLAA